MAERFSEIGAFQEYQAYHFTALQSDTALDSNSHGHFVKGIFVGKLGTSLQITLGNGATGTAANVLTVFVPAAVGYYEFPCTADMTLHVALAGTGFDVTIFAKDMGV